LKERVLFSWSGGKDSSMALYEMLRTDCFEIAALLTTVTDAYDRVSMHGVRRTLLEQQADSLGLPLEKVLITTGATNGEYEHRMAGMLERYRAQGISAVAFGDIFLQDLKSYRERNLARLGMRGIFPIWRRNSHELAQTFIRLGFQAITTCVDSQVLDRRFVGRLIDESFLSDLPSSADPCGENGEFHSFAIAGPIFRNKVDCIKGEIVLRDNRFYFCDLIPAALEKDESP
jgi:uncharacterized protein (TIGR00290 family)